MYSVLIVDDEPWVAYGLANLIDWESFGFRIIGEANDGLSALTIIINKQPALVVSDIRMPGLDGIQLLEKIKENGLDTKVVLVSGYAEFEYAQQAIKFGAYDYLLKQVDKSKLTETVLRLKQDLHHEEQSSRDMEMMLDDLFEWLEPDHTLTIGNFLSNKGIVPEFPHFRFLCSSYSGSIASFFKEGMMRTKDLNVISLRTGQNKAAVLLSYDESKAPLQFLDYISEHLSEAQYTGISSIGIFSTPLAKLYQESDIAMSTSAFHQDSSIVSYKLQELSGEVQKKLIQLELSIKEQAREKINELLDSIQQYCKENRLNIDHIAILYNQIISVIYKYYGQSNRSFEMEHLHYEQLLRYYESIELLFLRLKSFFDRLTEADMQTHNVQIEKVMAYIDSCFTEDILLSSIAKDFKISIGYLSTLIKKETGATYSDYILNKRLTMAKGLLSDPSLSVHEIVQRVGYKDYFHFNKLFKKHFGITPSKYRKL